MPIARCKGRSSQRGFTLIEALITFVILSIGLLGIAGLQALSKTSQHQSIQRTRAVGLAEALVERIAALPETHPNVLAFCLMMIRLNACMGCVSGSYRFMRGCEACSQQTIARYQGTDEELIALFYQAKEDLRLHAKGESDLTADAPEPEPEDEE